MRKFIPEVVINTSRKKKSENKFVFVRVEGLNLY